MCKKETEDRKCVNCGGQHAGVFTGCITFQDAREISRVNITEKISYAEAVKNKSSN